MMVFESIRCTVFQDILQKLPAHLSYHNEHHTSHVIDKTIFLAQQSKATEHELHLLKLAALFHDTGFIEMPEEHEQRSCKIARSYLEKDYPEADLKKICGMIMATKIPQSPNNPLEFILADADLEYLGTDLFEEIGDTLFKELQHFNPDLTPRAWDEIQLGFMQKHNYHTEYCQKHRQPKKQENLMLVKKRLELV